MAIEFTCRCGARFRVPEVMAGKSALCQACKQVVVVPQATVMPQPIPTRPIPPVGNPYVPPSAAFQPGQSASYRAPAPPFAPDADLLKELEAHRKLSDSSASNPGMLRISNIKYILSFPKWPLVWLSLLFLSFVLLCGVTWFGILPLLFFAVANLGYWYIVRTKFVAGCVNPAVVVSLDPPLVAVMTDLSKGMMERDWTYVRVLPQPLSGMTGGPPVLGQRLATVAYYSHSEETDPHWESFAPTVVNCVSFSQPDIVRVFGTLGAEDWQQLAEGLKQIPQPVSEGLYKVELKPPLQQPLTLTDLTAAVGNSLQHQPDKLCYVATSGIPSHLLQAAVAAIAPGVNSASVLAVVLANKDASGKQGMLMAADGVYYRLSDAVHGKFRWQDIWGAGTSQRQFEILLTNRQRLRFDDAFRENGTALEQLLDGLAKRDF
ncbi:DUF3239 domain-containing protein [Anatilimnocola sp. NA78]|uniref:DUF3239 domain-containing protein n=1 Tax=Anatilimnocola sp. NA78 TaxID=3415683 RepID=UPI003CE57D8A